MFPPHTVQILFIVAQRSPLPGLPLYAAAMVTQRSESAPGQFAAAIRKADPRSRAAVNPAVQHADIQHGHDGETADEKTWAERLMPGPPRNADGTERAD
jgi:hypothetical protein